jgi:PTS system mannose-specific IIB component/fructoselysine and glucoselysine-specific PTS system IIB component
VSIVLFRIDERLIHGQVVIGWGHELRPDRYIVVDDEIAASEWEQELYRLGAGEAEVVFATVDAARERLAEWRVDSARSVLLTPDVSSMERLARGGTLSGEEVNLGGLHAGPDRSEVLTYLYLTQEDRDDLGSLAAEGVTVSARDLPDAARVDLKSLLKP